ncbi:MAG: polysaccharide deacetylase [Hyphomicrobiales bacterium]|nr:polysaccharide deacetylase [Hyphomicrobiales bacterium]
MKVFRVFFPLCLAFGAPAIATAAPDCAAPAAVSGPVENYSPVFSACRDAAGAQRLATRAFTAGGTKMLLTVDPQSLRTQIAPAACWTCAPTTNEAQKDTRLMRAVAGAGADIHKGGPVSQNAGLTHGAGEGAYVTGDLCPTAKPLDRSFIETMMKQGPHTPLALAVSGLWIKEHPADFQWLVARKREGALDISWVDHSYRHRYTPKLDETKNYLMQPGSNIDAEITETEKTLISAGQTPSVFFRFPGLVADAALMEKLRARHLVALGADAWLVLSPPPRAGSVVLVHPNGNEPAGIRLFSKYLEAGKIPRPFRRIEDAP